MARTAEGEQLTAQHQQAQLAIRAQALRDYLSLWPIWQGDDESFTLLIAATLPLLRFYHRTSAAVAVGYFDAFRRAERASGNGRGIIANALDEAKAAEALRITGQAMTRKALRAGQPPEIAMRTALVRTSGTVTRQVLTGSRDTLVRSTGEDRQAVAWARVTDADPCVFCRVLASRGAVYRGEETAEFQAHDACACGAEPHYEGAALPPGADRFLDEYNAAQREARAAGELKRGTQNDALNAYRRWLDARERQPA